MKELRNNRFWWMSVFFVLGAMLHGCGDDADSSRVSAILALSGSSATGQTLYVNNCGSSGCHGSTGDNGSVESLYNDVPGESDKDLVELFLEGEGSMPSVSYLSDQEIADILAYVTDTFQ